MGVEEVLVLLGDDLALELERGRELALLDGEVVLEDVRLPADAMLPEAPLVRSWGGRVVQVGSQTTSGDQWWKARKACWLMARC